MKKALIVLFMGMGLVASAQEVLSTISYNPARDGNYSYLKVASQASLRGGLNVKGNMDITSNGTVNLTSQLGNYQVPTVSGAVKDTKIDMSNTEFDGNAVTVNGGEVSFKKANGLSTVTTLQKATEALFYAKTMNLNSLSVAATNPGSVGLNGSDNSAKDPTKGFYLVGNDIPYPSTDYVTNDGKTMGVSLNTSKYPLKWVARKTNESTPKTVYVLALANESGSSDDSSSTKCTWNTTYSSENCSMSYYTYCKQLADGTSYADMCGAKTIKANCGTPTSKDQTCTVWYKENHGGIGCSGSEENWSKNSVTVGYLRVYGATCTTTASKS